MIRDTLELLRTGTRSMSDMAAQLGVGMEDLRQRLRILEDKGLIEAVTGQSDCLPASCIGCRGCGCKEAPRPSPGGTYVLTEKGKRVVEKI